MGFSFQKMTLGTGLTGREAKRRLIMAMNHALNILYGPSDKTINMYAKDPMQVTYRLSHGTPVELETMRLDEKMLKKLVESKYFEIHFNVYTFQIAFKYDRRIHMDNALECNVKGHFKENMHKHFLGFILEKNVIGSEVFYQQFKDRFDRVHKLIFGIFKKHLGDTFYHQLSRGTAHNYVPDAIYISIFGFQFTIRRKI